MSIQRCCLPPRDVTSADFTNAATLFKAISDPSRLVILAWLQRAEDDVCVCDFTGALPLNQPTVSHHLKILRDAGLVTCERRGTWVYYRLAPEAHRHLTAAFDSIFPQKVTA
jgi:ArsR family transcriptional regulator